MYELPIELNYHVFTLLPLFPNRQTDGENFIKYMLIYERNVQRKKLVLLGAEKIVFA